MRVDTDIAWAAGFIDGEGWFGATVRPNKWKSSYTSLRLEVAQKDREVLDKLLSIFPEGRVGGPYLRRDSLAEQSYYRFSLRGTSKVQSVAQLLWPYLSTAKKNQYLAAEERIKRG